MWLSLNLPYLKFLNTWKLVRHIYDFFSSNVGHFHLIHILVYVIVPIVSEALFIFFFIFFFFLLNSLLRLDNLNWSTSNLLTFFFFLLKYTVEPFWWSFNDSYCVYICIYIHTHTHMHTYIGPQLSTSHTKGKYENDFIICIVHW